MIEVNRQGEVGLLNSIMASSKRRPLIPGRHLADISALSSLPLLGNNVELAQSFHHSATGLHAEHRFGRTGLTATPK
jgi:hypothetical protein